MGPVGQQRPHSDGSLRRVRGDRSASFAEQCANVTGDHFLACGTVPVQFARPKVPHVTLAVDQVDRWPPIVPPGVPGFLVVIDCNRECQLRLGRLALHPSGVPLGVGLGRVHTDDLHIVFRELLGPLPVPGIVADAVDSTEGVKVQDHDLATE